MNDPRKVLIILYIYISRNVRLCT